MTEHSVPLDVVRAYLVEASRALEEAEVSLESEELFDQLPATYFARMLHLGGAALDISEAVPGAAPGIVLRSAVESWIDCCYHLYCGPEALLNGLERSVLEREKFLLVEGLTESQRREISDQREALEAMVPDAIESGLVSPGFKPNGRLSIKERLRRAIAAKGPGAGADYQSVYDLIYTGLSAVDTHATLALDSHLFVHSGLQVKFLVHPQLRFEMPPLFLLMAYLAVGAGNDVFANLGVQDVRVDDAARAVVVAMARLAEEVRDVPAV